MSCVAPKEGQYMHGIRVSCHVPGNRPVSTLSSCTLPTVEVIPARPVHQNYISQHRHTTVTGAFQSLRLSKDY